jgi:sigma-B regulation protein RsbU (phosphoserine phosphatase)
MTGGTILGCMENYKYQSKKVKLIPGDLLFLYTDGVTEAFNKQDQVYGEERLEDYLYAHLSSPIEIVVKESLKDVMSYSFGLPQSDDITLLSVRYNG